MAPEPEDGPIPSKYILSSTEVVITIYLGITAAFFPMVFPDEMWLLRDPMWLYVRGSICGRVRQLID